jgi:glucose-6-phosphate isomerase
MESLGKELDLSGAVVNQGLAVYGNKGSTDQHAYVQQLRDGLHNFFAVFIEVLKDRSPRTHASPLLSKLNPERLDVEPGVTSGDYLAGFLLGTRAALFEKDRESVTVTVSEVRERTVGMLIALFERAVGLYASLINVNAYHQPGVEAGKKAAARVLTLQEKVVTFVRTAGAPVGVDEIAAGVGSPDEVETVFKIVRRLAVNERMTIQRGASLFEDRYYCA